MIREYLWDGTFVTLRLCYREGHFPERITLFDCDSHLAQTVQLLNEKGCCTTGCCEGHPCRTVSASGRRIRRGPVILAGGYLDFCRPEDRDAFLAALTPQGDQFYAVPSPAGDAARLCWRLRCSGTGEAEIRALYEAVWHTLLQAAQALPARTNSPVESATLLPGPGRANDCDPETISLSADGTLTDSRLAFCETEAEWQEETRRALALLCREPDA